MIGLVAREKPVRAPTSYGTNPAMSSISASAVSTSANSSLTGGAFIRGPGERHV